MNKTIGLLADETDGRTRASKHERAIVSGLPGVGQARAGKGGERGHASEEGAGRGGRLRPGGEREGTCEENEHRAGNRQVARASEGGAGAGGRENAGKIVGA